MDTTTPPPKPSAAAQAGGDDEEVKNIGVIKMNRLCKDTARKDPSRSLMMMTRMDMGNLHRN